MVQYTEVDLDNDKVYHIQKAVEAEWDNVRWWKTCHNLDLMLKMACPIRLIIPERMLTKDELEEYRKFFCHHAKEIGRNCIYFEGPVTIESFLSTDV